MSQGPLPYSQTILVDCNRRQSVEFSASNLAQTNNALFTNQVSSGITLDIGDTVSIQSAHISQRGAGGDIIEFAGKTLGQKNVSYTEQINTSHIGLGQIPVNTPHANYYIQLSPEGFAMERNETITEQIQEVDTQANMIISYYKNANGENNIGLPRNWGNASSFSSLATAGGVHYLNPVHGHVANGSFWEVKDGYPVGAQTFPQSASHVSSQDWNIVDGYNASGDPCYFRKIKQDNARYTLFKQKLILWNTNYVGQDIIDEYLLNTANASQANNIYISDPAIHPYIKYKQKVPLSVPVGFNSPESVAADLTNQLTKTDDPIFIDPIGTENRESVIVNSTTNRAFPATNYVLFNSSFNSMYFRSTEVANTFPTVAIGPPRTDFDAAPAYVQMACQYLNSYAYVGFKRPEIVEAGRDAFMPQGADTLLDVGLAAQNASAEITTNIPWNDENLQKLKRFFDSQALYPELLKGAITDKSGQTNYSASVNPSSASLSGSFAEEARFLHLDLKKRGDNFAGDPVGDDMYNVSFTSDAVFPIPPVANASDKSSVPVFIAYNKNSSHLNGSIAEGTSYETLAFGFAKKINIGSPANPILFIGFTTEKIGGIPVDYYTEQGGQIRQATKIGYDYHFNAFGNAAIIPSSGFSPLQYFGQQQYVGAETIRNAYIGANNPVYKFNDVEGRFEFENLHTSEKVGNFYNAGDPDPTTELFAPPESGQAGQDCYKINKQLHYTTWSPSMFPYSNIDVQSNTPPVGGVVTNQKTFVRVNPNLDIGRIYDSHGGVAIEDMGYSEKNWSQGFWGLCGFEYGQFNASGSDVKNRLIKYNDDTTNVNVMTTNADISSVDSQSYITNIFGANLYSQMLDSRVNYFNASKNLANIGAPDNAGVSPASVILASSTRITANDLPRRLLRGYFLLKSDILDQANFYETSNPLQTMGIVGKYQGNDDFISYDGGGPTFTCTRKKTITSIQSQILDPEGSLGQVGDNSGVVYRIDKQISTDLKFADNLFASMNQPPP
jgi:hypothetical protein